MSESGKVMHLAGKFSTIDLSVDLDLDGSPVISDVRLSLPDDVVDYRCTAWTTDDGVRVPREVVIESRSTDGKESSKLIVKFLKFDLRDPSTVSVKKMTWIPEMPGFTVIDAFKKHAYTRSADGGFRWLPFYDPVSGNTTLGPELQK